MSLITLQDLSLSVGGPLLFDRAQLSIEPGERVAVIGRNGVGKSTLLRLIAGELKPDEGELRLQSGLRIARLEQEAPAGLKGSVFAVIAAALGEAGALLEQYHRLSQSHAALDSHALGEVQHRIEAIGAWSLEQRVEDTLKRMNLPQDADFASLSGGMKRRALLGRALVVKPDLLLLDEPTNHLDLEAIAWLEELVADFPGTVLFITHDRRFLARLATRIVELDRGRITSWPGDYANYLRRREERLNAELLENARFDKKLAQEEVWIRQGVKARRTRNEGRVRALEELRRQRAARRESGGNVRAQAQSPGASGRKVIEAQEISFSWGDQPIIERFSTTIMRGDRVGIIGPNGSGKTTLLNLLLGELRPQSGTVRLGTQLEVAYFDQQRQQLDETLSAAENVAGGRDFVVLDGQPRHVMSYLQDFLFAPDRARAPITALSGGERNRLLLARILARPANLLVMDEPTNDLDIETLELLEELLGAYSGTLLLVSHDRVFLDNVVTSTLVLEGAGRVGEYVGGYADWLRQRPTGGIRDRANLAAAAKLALSLIPARPPEAAPPTPAALRRKLSYKDSRELEQLPAQIAAFDARLAAVTAQLNDPAAYERDPAAYVQAGNDLATLQGELDAAYQRWEALERKQAGGGSA